MAAWQHGGGGKVAGVPTWASPRCCSAAAAASSSCIQRGRPAACRRLPRARAAAAGAAGWRWTGGGGELKNTKWRDAARRTRNVAANARMRAYAHTPHGKSIMCARCSAAGVQRHAAARAQVACARLYSSRPPARAASASLPRPCHALPQPAPRRALPPRAAAAGGTQLALMAGRQLPAKPPCAARPALLRTPPPGRGRGGGLAQARARAHASCTPSGLTARRTRYEGTCSTGMQRAGGGVGRAAAHPAPSQPALSQLSSPPFPLPPRAPPQGGEGGPGRPAAATAACRPRAPCRPRARILPRAAVGVGRVGVGVGAGRSLPHPSRGVP